MKILCLVWGILAVLGMMLAMLPCVGALNWLNIPFAAVGLAVSLVMLFKAGGDEPKGFFIAGIACCGAAVVLGGARLILGAGVL